VSAAGFIPQELSVQGVLRNGSGQLQTTSVMVSVKFFSASTAGGQLGNTIGPNNIAATNGLFTMPVPLGNTDLSSLLGSAEIWMEVTADADPSPRSRVEPEMYALAAGVADGLSAQCVGCVTDAQL